jgi:hypothetical protein
LTRASAAYKLCKIGRVRDAINREQDMEINAIANMLAATRYRKGKGAMNATRSFSLATFREMIDRSDPTSDRVHFTVLQFDVWSDLPFLPINTIPS